MALRKARVLHQAGARLAALSREYSPEFRRFSKRNRIPLRYAHKLPRTFGRAWLVVAATSDRLFNHAVYRKCKRERLWVNVVDDPAHSTFIVPSVLRRGGLQIAISTGGASPYLAKLLRMKLSRAFGPAYVRLVRSLGRERQKVKQLIPSASKRRFHWKELVSSRLRQTEHRTLRGGETIR